MTILQYHLSNFLPMGSTFWRQHLIGSQNFSFGLGSLLIDLFSNCILVDLKTENKNKKYTSVYSKIPLDMHKAYDVQQPGKVGHKLTISKNEQISFINLQRLVSSKHVK